MLIKSVPAHITGEDMKIALFLCSPVLQEDYSANTIRSSAADR